MKSFTWSTRVRASEIGADGALRPISALHLLQETGVMASEANGYGPKAYFEMGMTFMVYRVDVIFDAAIQLHDQLTFRTWVSDFKRVRSQRETVVTSENGTTLLRAQVMWIFMDAATHRPARMKDAFHDAFAPDPGQHAITEAPPDAAPQSEPPTSLPTRAVRVAQWSDLDGLGHVNHAHSLGYVLDEVAARHNGNTGVLHRLTAQYGGALALGETASIRELASQQSGARVVSQHDVTGPKGLVLNATLVRHLG